MMFRHPFLLEELTAAYDLPETGHLPAFHPLFRCSSFLSGSENAQRLFRTEARKEILNRDAGQATKSGAAKTRRLRGRALC